MQFTYKTLSVRQPFAEMLVSGWKPIENRSWSTTHRGVIAIHASQTFTNEEAQAAAAAHSSGIPIPNELDTACIIGAVRLVDVIHVDETPESKPEWETYLRRIGYQFGTRNVRDVVDNIIDHLGDEYCWIVDSPRRITELKYTPGRQGLYPSLVQF